MTTFALAFAVIVLAILGMAVGVLCGRPAIQGSCGGVAGDCALCTGSERCQREHEES